MGQTESSSNSPPSASRRHSNGPQSRQHKLSTASACSYTGKDSATNSPSKESFLTQRQKTALQKSWKKSPRTGLDNIGAQIFMKIYMRDRSVGKMFGMQKVALHELKYHKFFQSHAMTFTKSLDFIVANLDNVPAIRRFCRRLGKSHINYIERGFKLEYWDIFAEALTECAISWEGGIRCRDILVGWRKLISFVIEEMRVTFLKEKRDRFNNGSPSEDADSNPDNLPIDGISLDSTVPKWNPMDACPMNPSMHTPKSPRRMVGDVYGNGTHNSVHRYDNGDYAQTCGNGFVSNELGVHNFGHSPIAHKRSYVPAAHKINYVIGSHKNSYAMEMIRQRADEYEQCPMVSNYVTPDGRRRAASLQPRNYGG